MNDLSAFKRAHAQILAFYTNNVFCSGFRFLRRCKSPKTNLFRSPSKDRKMTILVSFQTIVTSRILMFLGAFFASTNGFTVYK